MNKKLKLALGVVSMIYLVAFGWVAVQTSAHGTNISYNVTRAIEIEAAFDTGEPMANAQVVVYSPEDPATPWLTGEADGEGRFIFSPDPDVVGMWDISIRTAGHGEMIHIPVEEDLTVAAPTSSGVSNSQRWLMAGAIIWGFVGTALFFSKGSKN